MEDGDKAAAGLGTLRAVLAILQWWGFNVTVIIMNKWIFQVPSVPTILPQHSSPIHSCSASDLDAKCPQSTLAF